MRLKTLWQAQFIDNDGQARYILIPTITIDRTKALEETLRHIHTRGFSGVRSQDIKDFKQVDYHQPTLLSRFHFMRTHKKDLKECRRYKDNREILPPEESC